MLRSALSFKKRAERSADSAEQTAAGLWGQVDRSRIVDSWRMLVPSLTVAIMRGQADAGQSAQAYVDEAIRVQGGTNPYDWQLNSDSLVGWASDGRLLDSLLMSPAWSAVGVLNRGGTLEQAFNWGLAESQMLASTQVADAYRAATSVASTARNVTMYVRAITPPSCSRCIILAGSNHAWNTAFQRHPRCRCQSVPIVDGKGPDLITYPQDYFDSLSESEQNRIFTKAGAQAIRDGADMGRVVNARRKAAGLSAAGGQRGRLRADRYGRFMTHELTLTNVHGVQYQRLMPESIYSMARNQDDAIRMLREYGYIYETGAEREARFAMQRARLAR